MATTVEAIYENGVLRLSRPIELAEGAAVEVIVIPRTPQPEQQTPAEILAELAALPVGTTDTGGLSGCDHDKILYGGTGS